MNPIPEVKTRTEDRDGMRITWHQPIPMDDGIILRADVFEELKKHPLDDWWHRLRSADLSKLTITFLSCANWGGQGIHPRGNFNGFIEAPAKQKWLEARGDCH